MEESIYNLIPKPRTAIPKKTMYRSKYDPNAPPTYSTFGLPGNAATSGRGTDTPKNNYVTGTSSTFGPPPEKTSINPCNFLKKKPSRYVLHNDTSHSKTTKKLHSEKRAKPKVPLREDKPIMGLKTCRNFITTNAVNAILMSPPQNHKTDKENNPPSNFIDKEDYGKIPDYLAKNKKQMARETEIVDRYLTAKMNGDKRHPHHEEMGEEERQGLIRQLKGKWDEVNGRYQKVCHRVALDTLGDKKRKEKHEAELQQLEDDINKLSRPGPLVIIS